MALRYQKPIVVAVLLLFSIFCVIDGQSILSKLVKDDHILVVNSIATKNVSSIMECQFFCAQNNGVCLSFNLLKLSQVDFECQILNVSTTTKSAKFMFRIGSSHRKKVLLETKYYYQRNKITKKSCLEWKQFGFDESGMYSIEVVNTTKEVYCDMKTDGGGWIVFQRRLNGFVNFNKVWKSYKDGFGNMNSTFWLGNEMLHQLTKYQNNGIELWMEATNFENVTKYTKFDQFKIGSENENYKVLSSVRYVSGLHGAGFLSQCSGTAFSTRDNDNDDIKSNCAYQYYSGWWFDKCLTVNLNGIYSLLENIINNKGIVWTKFQQPTKSLKTTKMMIR